MKSVSIIILSGLLLIPFMVGAEQNYVPLVGIPGVDPNNLSTEGYVQALYWLAISIAAFLAVIRIIFAGVKYMLTDVVTSKGDAKKDIQAALLGLVIVLGAVLILTTINPELTNFNALRNVEAVKVEGGRETRVNVVETVVDPLYIDRDDTVPTEVADNNATNDDESVTLSFEFTGGTYSNYPEGLALRGACNERGGKFLIQEMSAKEGRDRAVCIEKTE